MGVAAYLISKEIYIINNETVVAVVMGGVIYAMLRKVGQPITEFIDDRNQVCAVWWKGDLFLEFYFFRLVYNYRVGI